MSLDPFSTDEEFQGLVIQEVSTGFMTSNRFDWEFFSAMPGRPVVECQVALASRASGIPYLLWVHPGTPWTPVTIVMNDDDGMMLINPRRVRGCVPRS